MSPASLGFSMPFEGSAHAATWACWPFDDEEWRGQLEAARQEYAALIEQIRRCEGVELLCADDESEADAARRLSCAVRIHRVELDDVWFRDSGPTFLTRVHGGTVETKPVCWRFNAWGEKFEFELDARAARETCRRLDRAYFDCDWVLEGGAIETDGQGCVLTTRSSLLHPKRNPGKSERDYEQLFGDFLGAQRVVWLNAGLIGDHTDGHIDTLTRFVRPGQVVTCSCASSDDNYPQLEENRRKLVDEGFDVVELPIPDRARLFLGHRLPETYANFYLVNGAVIVPQYGDPQDEAAVSILGQLFPERRVEALPSSAIITSGGSFHCLTQQQPLGTAACA